MRKTKKQNRWLALALCLCMLAGVFPLSGMTYAAETGCNHTHDENCGYIEAVEGAPCAFTHAHDVACGYAEAKEATPCSAEAAHVHDEDCGYVEAVEGQPCTHVHDENCGGLAQNSGHVPCTQTEGCTLPKGHEGSCEPYMAMRGSPIVNGSTPAVSVPGGNAYSVDSLAAALGGSGNVTVNGSTVTLNTNVNLDKYIYVYSTSLTLDLNGHTLSASDSISAPGSYNSMFLITGVTLTLKNGTIKNNGMVTGNSVRAFNGGHIQLENIALIEGNIITDESSTLQINTNLAASGILMVSGNVKIANGATLDLRNGTIPVSGNRKFIVFKTDADEMWDTNTPLVLANKQTSDWFVELDTDESGLPEGYHLAYALNYETSEWKLQAPGFKVDYHLADHVRADSTLGSVTPGDTLIVTLTADSGYRIVSGNVNVFAEVNGSRNKRACDYNEETGILTVDNVTTDLHIEVLEKIVVTTETLENGQIEIEDIVGTKTHDSETLAAYLERIIIRCHPNPGYRLSSLTVNGKAFESGSSQGSPEDHHHHAKKRVGNGGISRDAWSKWQHAHHMECGKGKGSGWPDVYSCRPHNGNASHPRDFSIYGQGGKQRRQ